MSAGAGRGFFLTFEGGEGVGKTTQLRLLAQRLERAGIAHLSTREPGGTPGAEAIRKLLVAGAVDRWQPMTEALLHQAARSEHVASAIRPALQSGRWVICDRFVDSTLAYQGAGQGLGADLVHRLHDLTLGGLMPELTFVLDLPPGAGLERADRRQTIRGEDRYERMDMTFHENLRGAFLEIAARAPERCVVIDASREEAKVAEDIARTIRERLDVDLGP